MSDEAFEVNKPDACSLSSFAKHERSHQRFEIVLQAGKHELVERRSFKSGPWTGGTRSREPDEFRGESRAGVPSIHARPWFMTFLYRHGSIGID